MIFSLLPRDIRVEIASYMFYKDIKALYCTDKVSEAIMYRDIPFWQNLITGKFSEPLWFQKMFTNPMDYFYDLEQTTYRVTVTIPDKQPLTFVSRNSNIIAVTILLLSKIFYETPISEEDCLGEELNIIRYDGKMLSGGQAYFIVARFSFDNSGIHSKCPRTFTFYINSTDKIVIAFIFSPPYITNHVLKLLAYIGATDISID